jgi:hypothetical protein
MSNYRESQGRSIRGYLGIDRWVLTRLGTKRGSFEASCPEPLVAPRGHILASRDRLTDGITSSFAHP